MMTEAKKLHEREELAMGMCFSKVTVTVADIRRAEPCVGRIKSWVATNMDARNETLAMARTICIAEPRTTPSGLEKSDFAAVEIEATVGASSALLPDYTCQQQPWTPLGRLAWANSSGEMLSCEG
jgi:hypothetical protein